jgi:hypothetical protein
MSDNGTIFAHRPLARFNYTGGFCFRHQGPDFFIGDPR